MTCRTATWNSHQQYPIFSNQIKSGYGEDLASLLISGRFDPDNKDYMEHTTGSTSSPFGTGHILWSAAYDPRGLAKVLGDLLKSCVY